MWPIRLLLLLLAGLIFSVFVPDARGQRATPPATDREREPIWQLGIGGQLYNDWFGLTLLPRPGSQHILWTGANNVPAAETWRCVNCHGWDCHGSAGVGGEWGPLPGTPSLRHLTTHPPEVISSQLIDTPRHRFAALPPEARQALGQFLSLGQQETLALIAVAANGTGRWQDGAWHFSTVCAVCHGSDGLRLNLGSNTSPAGIGAIAVANPWKFLHAARFGHRGVMPSFVMLGDTSFIDLLAFASSRLPRPPPPAAPVRR